MAPSYLRDTSKACSPSTASSTKYPASFSMARTTLRTNISSSASRITNCREFIINLTLLVPMHLGGHVSLKRVLMIIRLSKGFRANGGADSDGLTHAGPGDRAAARNRRDQRSSAPGVDWARADAAQERRGREPRAAFLSVRKNPAIAKRPRAVDRACSES